MDSLVIEKAGFLVSQQYASPLPSGQCADYIQVRSLPLIYHTQN